MKVKILKPSGWYKNDVGYEFNVNEYEIDSPNLRFQVKNKGWVYNYNVVITELPESFCVKRCDENNRDDWNKYLQWLNKQKNYSIPMFGGVDRYKYYGVIGEKLHSDYLYPFGTEIHIDDMIKHIDYMESQQHIKGGEEFNKESQLTVKMDKEFDLTTNEGRLAYARQNYPIGTKYIPLNGSGVSFGDSYINTVKYEPVLNENVGIEGGVGWIYTRSTWAEIIKEEESIQTNLLELIRLFPELPTDYAKKLVQKTLEVKNGCLNSLVDFIESEETPKTFYEYILGSNSALKADYVWREVYNFKNKKLNMETQKLSRQGLKEIHGVACTTWKETLEQYGSRNPLEDYIELTQEEVNRMFYASDEKQKTVLSKHLKYDDDSVDVTKFNVSGNGFCDDNYYIIRDRQMGKYKGKSFLLSEKYSWEFREDEFGQLCLIPTKKK